jgi:hypothetical protein
MPTTTNKWSEGSFHTWPDQTHNRAHSQQLPEMLRSWHVNNPYQKLTCASCHDPHSLNGGPAQLPVETFEFDHPGYADNTLCLACHATYRPFEAVMTADVAALQVRAGRAVTNGGEPVIVTPADQVLSLNRVARAMAEHMQVGAGMGGVIYTPADPASPVGRCTSCHMPKIGKLFDVDDDAQYHLAFDQNGLSAVAEGNVGSHVFDIVWPGQSSVLKNDDPSKGHDYDIMPNSCSACHAFARISGDND